MHGAYIIVNAFWIADTTYPDPDPDMESVWRLGPGFTEQSSANPTSMWHQFDVRLICWCGTGTGPPHETRSCRFHGIIKLIIKYSSERPWSCVRWPVVQFTSGILERWDRELGNRGCYVFEACIQVYQWWDAEWQDVKGVFQSCKDKRMLTSLDYRWLYPKSLQITSPEIWK